MVVHIREAGEGEREAGADRGAEAADVEVGGGVPAFVLGLGVDHQAVGARFDRARPDPRLGGRLVAVDELPGADLQPGPVQFGNSGPLNCSQ